MFEKDFVLKFYTHFFNFINKFTKKDKKVEEAIRTRIIDSYIKVADIMVKSGMNSDAVRYLKKAGKYSPDNFNIRYKLAIIYSDLDPELSVKYFEKLLKCKKHFPHDNNINNIPIFRERIY